MELVIDEQPINDPNKADTVAAAAAAAAAETPSQEPSAGPAEAEGTQDQLPAVVDQGDQPSLPRRSRFRGLTW